MTSTEKPGSLAVCISDFISYDMFSSEKTDSSEVRTAGLICIFGNASLFLVAE
jgi:hypothetical protein